MKKLTFLSAFIFILMLGMLGFALAQDEISAPADNAPPAETAPSEPEFNVDPGITPDSPLYVIDNLIEQITVGDNPERALEYKEEKIAEAQAMIEKGKPELAEQVLEKAVNYGNIIEKEVRPEMKREVEESSEKVQYAMQNMKEEIKDKNFDDVEKGVDEVIAKERDIGTAAGLVAKINELCNALAKLDPLQYADTCRPKKDSPNWMKEKDKELTKEQEAQAKIFFDKLSQCFEDPKQCDCKGMGVQSFEDFCIEKSKSAIACMNGDEKSCNAMEEGDPSDLLPSYLIPAFKKIEDKYMGSKMELHMPKECADAGATTPKECNKIMFKLYSPKECVDAGLSGTSREDEIKCKKLMFEQNTPQECIDAGISAKDPDAPRKCSKIMFQLNAPQECIDAGLSGESREDQNKCAELMKSKESGVEGEYQNAPKFNRDCNAIQNAEEKIKCYEEFYNNAQTNMRDDFRQGVIATTQKVEGGQKCPDSICDDFEKRNPSACPADCGGSQCQTSEQVERLKQDCKNRGQDATVETRAGCPWVICIGGAQGSYGTSNYVAGSTAGQVPTTGQTSSGQKCPDGICDDYERMNPYACPADCGGQVQQPSQEQQIIQQPPQEQLPPVEQQPIIEQPASPTEAPTTEISSPETTSEGESAPITGAVTSENKFLGYWWN